MSMKQSHRDKVKALFNRVELKSPKAQPIQSLTLRVNEFRKQKAKKENGSMVSQQHYYDGWNVESCFNDFKRKI